MVAAVSFALVAATVGYMAHYALAVKAVVPEASVERISTHATQGGYVVRFRAPPPPRPCE